MRNEPKSMTPLTYFSQRRVWILVFQPTTLLNENKRKTKQIKRNIWSKIIQKVWADNQNDKKIQFDLFEYFKTTKDSCKEKTSEREYNIQYSVCAHIVTLFSISFFITACTTSRPFILLSIIYMLVSSDLLFNGELNWYQRQSLK